MVHLNQKILKSLIKLRKLPDTNRNSWLENARDGANFIIQNLEKDEEAVLLALGGREIYIHSFLIHSEVIKQLDHESLKKLEVRIEDSWRIDNSSEERVALFPPFGDLSALMREGAEKLVYLREFRAAVDYNPPVEINQKLVHALDLHYMDERDAYCRINNSGDIESVVTVCRGKSPMTAVVTIRRDYLDDYMVLSGTSLLTDFFFDRLIPGEVNGHEYGNYPQEHIFPSESSYYRSWIIPNRASEANGYIVSHPNRSHEEVAKKWGWRRELSKQQHAKFKIFDWKNNRCVETFASPDHITNYFTDSDLPWEISPAFFSSEVLGRYKNNRQKYTIGDRGIVSSGGWSLRSYDINDAGQVFAYIGDLAQLPYKEQQYWAIHSEWPKGITYEENGMCSLQGIISQRAYENDILGEPASQEDSLHEIKRIIGLLNQESVTPAWWSPRNAVLIEKVLCPVGDTQEEWEQAIKALDQLVVEGFKCKGLIEFIRRNGGEPGKDHTKSLALLECAFLSAGKQIEEAKNLVGPLRELHGLRNKEGHGDINGMRKEVRSARKNYGSLRQHFKELTGRIHSALQEIVRVLG